MPRRSRWLVLLWTLLVLYPNPQRLLVSVPRAWTPPVDAGAVRELAATLPDDPRAIEEFVNRSLVPYAVPWHTYHVPWYVPTVAEVLTEGQGDCQARAIVLASLRQAKGIPATFVGSFDHLWVEYPGKQPTAIENSSVALVAQQLEGAHRIQWPTVIDWRASWAIERAYVWDAMPGERLALLVMGWLLLGQHHRLIGWGWKILSYRRLSRSQSSMKEGNTCYDRTTVAAAGR